METITNMASTAANTASKLIYGEQPTTETETKTNETAGKEPISGEQGKGTVAEPYDQGNAPTPLASTANKGTYLDYKDKVTTEKSGSDDDFLKLNPTLDGPKTDTPSGSGDPKIHTNRDNETYTGMPIVPLNPDVATSGPTATSSSATHSTGTTEKAGVTDKVWKETSLDDISRTGAPGAGPSAPTHVTPADPTSATSGVGSTTKASDSSAIKTTAPDSVTAGSATYESHKDASKSSKTEAEKATAQPIEKRDTPSWTDTGVPSTVDPAKEKATASGTTKDTVVEQNNTKSPPLAGTTSHDDKDKDSKMSNLKEKLKTKLHIGSKDK